MRLVTILVLVSAVSVMFLAGCPNQQKPTPPPANVGYQTPPPTGEELGGNVPPGTGSGSIVTPPTGDLGPSAGPVDTTGARSYTVKAHEGLMGIARSQLGNEHRWQEILKLNPEIQPPDYRLKVGQIIKLPAK
jgi:nucleoid-associated protein YgaU